MHICTWIPGNNDDAARKAGSTNLYFYKSSYRPLIFHQIQRVTRCGGGLKVGVHYCRNLETEATKASRSIGDLTIKDCGLYIDFSNMSEQRSLTDRILNCAETWNESRLNCIRAF